MAKPDPLLQLTPNGWPARDGNDVNGDSLALGRPARHTLREGAARVAAKAAIVLLVAASAAGVVTFAVFNPGRNGGYNTTVEHFVLPRLDKPGTISLSKFRGQPVVVNFFASWCPQCPNQLRAITSEAAQQHGRVEFIEVNARETGNGPAFAARLGLTSTVTVLARDVNGSEADGLYEALGGTGTMPLTAFYNAEGKLLASHVGFLETDAIAAQLTQLYGQEPR